MTAKTSGRRRAAFFAALAATGNQTLAAERAKVSRSWVTLHRMTDPAFAAEIERALATAKGTLDRATGVGPAVAWRGQGGEELIVRRSNGRWAQVARARLEQWTPRVEARFLHALAETCNVKRACDALGLSPQSAYGHRRRWPDFAERWDKAVEQGYDNLSIAMVAAAGAMLGDPTFEAGPVMEPVSFGEAVKALGLHRRRATGMGRKPGRVAKEPTMDEVYRHLHIAIEKVQRAGRAAERRAARTRD